MPYLNFRSTLERILSEPALLNAECLWYYFVLKGQIYSVESCVFRLYFDFSLSIKYFLFVLICRTHHPSCGVFLNRIVSNLRNYASEWFDWLVRTDNGRVPHVTSDIIPGSSRKRWSTSSIFEGSKSRSFCR